MKKKRIVKKIALCVEYDGTNYNGWQKQKNTITTIQEKLETAISIIADHPINVICSGRTDSGVHSIGQIVHFNTTSFREDFSWILGINSFLPSDISVQWVKTVSFNFHARYSALSRLYRYVIYNSSYRNGLFSNFLNHIFKELDVKLMINGAKYLLGEHDFSGFRAKNCQSKSAFRNISRLDVFRRKFFVIIEIKANAFLYKMVRNIVGSLIEIGLKKKNVSWINTILRSKNRKLSGPTALARGLYLVHVDYPSNFGFPKIYKKFFL
ncbi:tRNA pseudouridine synthase A [Buchnera aphidicola (Tetraneura ulmi)]|uniref:tRNA pseudouridine(38-40) synthase TruA n=1 Tax=Buchnera aphidicola TaxID=9 RepID=UPI003463AE3E